MFTNTELNNYWFWFDFSNLNQTKTFFIFFDRLCPSLVSFCFDCWIDSFFSCSDSFLSTDSICPKQILIRPIFSSLSSGILHLRYFRQALRWSWVYNFWKMSSFTLFYCCLTMTKGVLYNTLTYAPTRQRIIFWCFINLFEIYLERKTVVASLYVFILGTTNNVALEPWNNISLKIRTEHFFD